MDNVQEHHIVLDAGIYITFPIKQLKLVYDDTMHECKNRTNFYPCLAIRRLEPDQNCIELNYTNVIL